MENNRDLCQQCKQTKFREDGVALARGLQLYTCVNCYEHAANYAEGQTRLCHACARKLGVCVLCGKPRS